MVKTEKHCNMMALDTEIIFKKFVTKDTTFSFTVIYTNLANMLFSYALIYYIMQ